MSINEACSEIINRSLPLVMKDEPSSPPEQVVAQGILKDMGMDMADDKSIWRKPVKMNFLERIWRPIRNLLFSEASLQYFDIKNNLTAVCDELKAKNSTITFEITSLQEEMGLKKCEEAKKAARDVLQTYANELKKEIATTKITVKDKSKLNGMITEIGRLLNSKELKGVLVGNIDSYFNEVTIQIARLDRQNPNLTQISEKLKAIEESAKNLPNSDYANSSLEKKIHFAFAQIKMKEQLSETKQNITKCTTGAAVIECVVRAKNRLQDSEEYKKLVPTEQEILLSSLEEALKTPVTRRYKSLLDEFKNNSIAEIGKLGEDDIDAVNTLGIKLCGELINEASVLNTANIGILQKPMQEALEAIYPALGRALYQSPPAQATYDEGIEELKDLADKIRNSKLSTNDLKSHQINIEHQIALLENTNQYSTIIDRSALAPENQKRPFFKQYIEQLLNHKGHYINQLKEMGGLIRQQIGALTAAQMAQIKNAADAARKIMEDNHFGLGTHSVNDITHALRKSGYKPWMASATDVVASTAMWTTGTRDSFATACATHSKATEVIGAVAAGTIFAGLGWYIGDLGPIGAPLLGLAGLGVSAMMPEIKTMIGLPKSNRAVQLIAGPLIMATFALGAPYLASKWMAPPVIAEPEKKVHEDFAKIQNDTKTIDQQCSIINKQASIMNTTLAQSRENLGKMQGTVNKLGTAVKEIKVTAEDALLQAQQIEQIASGKNPDIQEVQDVIPDLVSNIKYIGDKAEKSDQLIGQLKGNLSLEQSNNANLQVANNALQGANIELQGANVALQGHFEELKADTTEALHPTRGLFWRVMGGVATVAGVGVMCVPIPPLQVAGGVLAAAGVAAMHPRVA